MDDATTSPLPEIEHGNRLTRPMVMLFLLTALMSVGYGSVFTLLADIRDRFGFSDTDVALIAFAGLFTGVLSQLFLARFSDRGHAVLMMRLGIGTAAFGMLWMTFAGPLWQWIAARLLLGLGSGMVGPAIRKIIIARDPQHIGSNLGRQAAFDIAGFVLGPALAAGLAQLFDLRAPFVVLAIAYTVAIFFISRIAPDAETVDPTPRKLGPLLRQPAMQSALAAAIGFYLTIGMFEALWSILLRDQGAATWLIGLTLSLFTLPMIVFAPKGGALAQRKGPINIVTLSISAAAIATFAYGISPLWLIVAISGFHAIADAFTMPANQVAVAMASPPEQLASGQGLLGATGLAVAAAAALVGGAVYDTYGRATIFSITAALMIVCIIVARWRWRAQPALDDITG